MFVFTLKRGREEHCMFWNVNFETMIGQWENLVNTVIMNLLADLKGMFEKIRITTDDVADIDAANADIKTEIEKFDFPGLRTTLIDIIHTCKRNNCRCTTILKLSEDCPKVIGCISEGVKAQFQIIKERVTSNKFFQSDFMPARPTFDMDAYNDLIDYARSSIAAIPDQTLSVAAMDDIIENIYKLYYPIYTPFHLALVEFENILKICTNSCALADRIPIFRTAILNLTIKIGHFRRLGEEEAKEDFLRKIIMKLEANRDAMINLTELCDEFPKLLGDLLLL